MVIMVIGWTSLIFTEIMTSVFCFFFRFFFQTEYSHTTDYLDDI